MTIFLRGGLLIAGLVAGPLRADDLIRPRVIVVATFEIGADPGDAPGEFQFWVEREKLTGSVAVPGLDHPVHDNDQGVYGVVSGTTVGCGLQLMALDPDRMGSPVVRAIVRDWEEFRDRTPGPAPSHRNQAGKAATSSRRVTNTSTESFRLAVPR